MRITKVGHACLFIEEGEARILVDPGNWNTEPIMENVHAVLLTHEHGDHAEEKHLAGILSRNPQMRVIAHEGLTKKLDAAGIPFEKFSEGARFDVNGISIEMCGTTHARIYGDMPVCQNAGYLIANRLYVPGDALHDVPKQPVEILGLPVGGPWMRMSEAIDYAKSLAPKIVFPLHDAMYTPEYRDNIVPRIVGGNLEAAGIVFRDMKAGATEEF